MPPAVPVVVLLSASSAHDRHSSVADSAAAKPIPFATGSSTLQLCSISVDPIYTEKKKPGSSTEAKKDKLAAPTSFKRRRRALVQIFARIRPSEDVAGSSAPSSTVEKEFCVATFILPRHEDMLGSAAVSAAASRGGALGSSTKDSKSGDSAAAVVAHKSSFVRRPLQSTMDLRFTMEHVTRVPRLLLVGEGWSEEPYSVSANVAVAGVITPLGAV